jgi:hypothetical protein
MHINGPCKDLFASSIAYGEKKLAIALGALIAKWLIEAGTK